MAEGVSSKSEGKMRVKLYVRADDGKWLESGTGFISTVKTVIDGVEESTLVAFSEKDESLLLESAIMVDTAYQKQQDTLIVWSDNDIVDLALSFQDKRDCDNVWSVISDVQGRDPNLNLTQDVFSESEDEDTKTSSSSSHVLQLLPECRRDLLPIIKTAMETDVNSEQQHRLTEFLCVNNKAYISSLCCDVYKEAERLGDVASLHVLYDIIQLVLKLNSANLAETLFSDSCIMNVMGILEYPPGGDRVPHRERFLQSCHFRPVFSLPAELEANIHLVAKLQFLLDNVLCSSHQESFTHCYAILYQYKARVVAGLMADNELMDSVCAELGSEDTEPTRLVDICLFLKELFCFLFLLEKIGQERCLHALLNYQLAPALAVAVHCSHPQVKDLCLELFALSVDLSVTRMREELCSSRGSGLLTAYLEEMAVHTDPERSFSQSFLTVLASLLSPQKSGPSFHREFCREHLDELLEPLMQRSSDDYHNSLLHSQVLDLLTFCVNWHTASIKCYVMQKDLFKRVSGLVSSRHSFLILSAIRFFRAVMGAGCEYFYRLLIRDNLLRPLVELLTRQRRSSAMVYSALLDLFHYLITENVSSLLLHLFLHYKEVLLETPLSTALAAKVQEYECLIETQSLNLCVRRKRRFTQPAPDSDSHSLPPTSEVQETADSPVIKRVRSEPCFQLGSLQLKA